MTEERETYTPEHWSILRDPFLQAMAAEMFGAEQMEAAFNSAHEVYAVILERVDNLWDEIRQKNGRCSAERIREALVAIAALAWRAAPQSGDA